MSSGRYLLAGEPRQTFLSEYDTGLVLAEEILRRRIPLDYCDLSTVDWKQDTRDYLKNIPVVEVQSVHREAFPFFGMGPLRKANVTEYDVILQRKDPPVDEAYIGHAKHFAHAPASIVQINHPGSTWRFSEHLLPQRFPKYAVPTFHCKTYEEFLSAVRSQPKEAVAKPLHLFSGKGISFFKNDAAESAVQEYWNQWKPEIVVQPYLPEVTQSGDLRILMMNRKMVGAVLRKPKEGSRLANLHQGASAVAFKPTFRQQEAAAVVSQDLAAVGLYLLGLDFIGDYLTEVNITCPSAVPQINKVMGIKAESIILDEIESLRKKLGATRA